MDKYRFIDELREFAQNIGADVRVNLVNPKGSPLDGCKLDTLNPNLLRECKLVSAIIIPKLTEAEKTSVDFEEEE
jgi:hypothetical protein